MVETHIEGTTPTEAIVRREYSTEKDTHILDAAANGKLAILLQSKKKMIDATINIDPEAALAKIQIAFENETSRQWLQDSVLSGDEETTKHLLESRGVTLNDFIAATKHKELANFLHIPKSWIPKEGDIGADDEQEEVAGNQEISFE